MKKLLALLLVIVMLFSVATVFAGCEDSGKKKKSSSSRDDDDEDDEDDEDEEDEDDKKDDETTAPEGDPTDPEPTDPEPTDPPVVLSPYTIYVVDEAGNPVSGVKVQICDDANLCKAPKTTNADGVAVYEDQELGNYKAQLTKLPEGYEVDDMDAYYVFGNETEVTIVIREIEPEPTEPTGTVLDPDNYFYNEDNTFYEEDSISVRPVYVYWQEDGSLCAQCAVINGYNETVYDLSLDFYSISNDDGLIAEGSFGVLEGTWDPYTYQLWTLTFDPSCVHAFGADLSTLTYSWEVS